MKTILLIEDNDLIRENTAELLELAGYRVYSAENGKRGIETALIHKPNLVICDILMPVMDGYGVLHIFNNHPKLSGIPFIFLTAKTERSDIRKGMELGADDYLTKPFDESDLLRAVESRLKRFIHLIPEENSSSTLNDPKESEHTPQTTGLQSLLTDRKTHAIPKKQYIYMEGDEPSRMYFLRSGQVKTIRTNAEGKELITGLYHSGDFFGYFALPEQNDYTDSAVTLEDSELIYIPKEEFLQLILSGPEICGQFIRLLSNRVMEQEKTLMSMAYNSLRRRVADALLRLHKQHPDEAIQLSRDNLAAIIGTATESLIRMLSDFKQSGLIKVTKSGGILIENPTKLSKCCQ